MGILSIVQFMKLASLHIENLLVRLVMLVRRPSGIAGFAEGGPSVDHFFREDMVCFSERSPAVVKGSEDVPKFGYWRAHYCVRLFLS